ncbi:hypothetical protein SLEP1_g42179 [Rubroshorea leprosula]|uniref:Uncharacterized protein n=1 Tax=Rubroshorea leprosula TaxID=152421 RepID=A0AAV5L9M1_9ROSI|nr:hypothetical protein SLEP1_g42179 [Rubroshorea leprosula]
MLDFAMELITQAASNSLFVFCFCNSIIVTILIASKPCSTFDQGTRIPLSVVSNLQAVKAQHLLKKRDNSTQDVFEVSNATNNPDREKEGTMEDHEKNNPGGRKEDDREDNDELRRRVEEFIAKVNRELRAEQFRIVS